MALKTVSSVQSHDFLRDKLLHDTLRCAYCFNFQFKDWDHMQHHISVIHSDMIHTGYVIEKGLLKLVKHKNVEPSQKVADNSNLLSTIVSLEKALEVKTDERSHSPLETKQPDGHKEDSFQSEKIPNSLPCAAEPGRSILKFHPSTFDKTCRETNQAETLQCYYCPGEVFASWALLKGHSYKCHISPLWNVDFKRKVSRKKVQQSEHNYGIALPNTGTKCNFCDKSFQGKTLLDIHIQHHHVEEQKNIPNSR